MNRILRSLALAGAFSAAGASALQAQTLLLDFGTTPATGQYTVNATAAPQLGGPAGLTGNLVYNAVSGSDNGTPSYPSSYQFSNGSTATGVSLSFTTGTAWTTMNNGPAAFTRVGLPGGRSGVGVFNTPAAPNNTNIYSDFVASANTNNTNDYLGLSIGGLAVGSYEVYVVTNNTYFNTAGAQTRQVRAGVGAAGITDYSSFATPTTLSYNFTDINTDTATWAAANGKYWTKFTLNISATDTTLYLGNFKSGDNQGGLFNGIQIVAVPEPSTYALIILGLGSLVVLRRFRRFTS